MKIKHLNITIVEEINAMMHRYYLDLHYDIALKLIRVQILLLEAAAKEGDSSAQYELALLYGESAYYRDNPFYNENKHIYWLKKAVKNGHTEAKVNLASVYMTTENDKYSNVLKGLSLIKEAYLEGDEVGKINYNICIKNLKKKSLLVKSIKTYFNKYPNKVQLFLEKNPDYAAALKL